MLKALYGYKQSPRLWSDYRDEELTKFKVSEDGRKFRLQQLLSEPNIWKILEVKRSKKKEEAGEEGMQDWVIVGNEAPEEPDRSLHSFEGNFVDLCG